MRRQSGTRLAVKILLIVKYALTLLLLAPVVVEVVDDPNQILKNIKDTNLDFYHNYESPVLLFLISVFVVTLYFLPTIFAFFRWHANVLPIYIINAVFGWTLLGWVGTLAWSFSSNVIPVEDPSSVTRVGQRNEPTLTDHADDNRT